MGEQEGGREGRGGREEEGGGKVEVADRGSPRNLAPHSI